MVKTFETQAVDSDNLKVKVEDTKHTIGDASYYIKQLLDSITLINSKIQELEDRIIALEEVK